MMAGETEDIDRVIESAIIANWKDLMPGMRTGSVHVEYACATGGPLDHLEVWVSTNQRRWLLACTYWLAADKTHVSGAHFENGYDLKGLAQILDVVMQHQSLFTLPPSPSRHPLLQITLPTEKQSAESAALVRTILAQAAA